MTSLTSQNVSDSFVMAGRAVVDEIVQRAGGVEITDEDSFFAASQFLRDIKGHKERLEAHRRSIVDPMNAQVKHVNEQFATLTEDVDDSFETVNGKVIAYQLEREQALEQETAELEAAASRAAMEGRQEDADAAMEAMIYVPTKTERPGGVSFRETWHARVTDFPTLIAAVHNNRSSLALLLPNKQALEKAAREKKGPSTIPGVEFYSVKGSAVSGR